MKKYDLVELANVVITKLNEDAIEKNVNLTDRESSLMKIAVLQTIVFMTENQVLRVIDNENV